MKMSERMRDKIKRYENAFIQIDAILIDHEIQRMNAADFDNAVQLIECSDIAYDNRKRIISMIKVLREIKKVVG
jgi:hypothetical protein